VTPTPAYIYRARVVAVHDGDTFTADVDTGFGVHAWIKVRLHGIDSPELGAADGSGLKARAALSHLITDQPLVLQSYRDARSFDRWVCDVWMLGMSVGQWMIDNGYGVAFMGTPLT
jgi:endonuclease YncB( thermonuclease family)